jgi:hypothetical protein
VFRLAANLSIPCFSVVNGVGSQLARLTNCGVYLNAGREVAVASTKVFLSQVVVLSLIAAWWAQRHVCHLCSEMLFFLFILIYLIFLLKIKYSLEYINGQMSDYDEIM